MEKLEKKIFAQALKFLSIREYSELELFNKIQKKYECNDSKLIKSVLNQLKEYNYLSDDRFTESKVKSLVNKKYGPNYIKLKMINFGVDSNKTNQEILKNNSSIEKNLLYLIERKFEGASFDSKNKLIKKLMNKGYDTRMIFSKIDEFLAKSKSS